jgi:hypothetical protein
MNHYTNHKVYVFGGWIRTGHDDIPPFNGTWIELLKFPDFIEFKKKHEITDKQMSLIKKGFHGWPLEDEKPHQEAEPLFPFGTHKGKPMSEVPDSYYNFLLGQPWVSKWPTVQLYAQQVRDRLQENGASKEEIYNLLQKIQ